jgi:hypothetical protein
MYRHAFELARYFSWLARRGESPTAADSTFYAHIPTQVQRDIERAANKARARLYFEHARACRLDHWVSRMPESTVAQKRSFMHSSPHWENKPWGFSPVHESGGA